MVPIPKNTDFNTTFYCVASIIDRLLKSFNQDNSFTKRLTELIKDYDINTELIGFPEDWKTEAIS